MATQTYQTQHGRLIVFTGFYLYQSRAAQPWTNAHCEHCLWGQTMDNPDRAAIAAREHIDTAHADLYGRRLYVALVKYENGHTHKVSCPNLACAIKHGMAALQFDPSAVFDVISPDGVVLLADITALATLGELTARVEGRL